MDYFSYKIRRAILLALSVAVLAILDYIANPNIKSVLYSNLITEGILTLMTAILFVYMGELRGRHFFKFLNYGFYLLFISFTTDTLDQLFLHGRLQTTILEKGILIIGYLLVFIGIKQWLEEYTRMNKSLSRQATTDDLTGLLNRRGFIQKLHSMANDGVDSQPIAILIGDLDNFKNINDEHGHIAGDTVLKHCSAQIRSQLNNQQWVGRWGGEEFAITSPKTTPEQAMKLAEQIRDHIAQNSYNYEGKDLNVTISIGLSQLSPSDYNIYNAIQRADKALYQSKANGRNRSTMSG
ncbi:GGDEF domain-containing protein [Marinicella sp. W31]|uniref:GGDEF domain-containing protein n=1 Tax=Marinicella sp. W31 TaxID=3023713 RepID=UPI003756721C